MRVDDVTGMFVCPCFEARVGSRATLRLLNAAWTREYGRAGGAAGTSASGVGTHQ